MSSHSTLIACALALAAMLQPAQAAGKVEVSYIEPEHYSDAGRSVIDRERTMKSLGEFFQTLAKRLPDGQTLRLEVLDIDLAGELRPTRHGDEIRVLNDRADWPHMKLRYTLQANGQTLKSGQADLSDMSYMSALRGYPLLETDLPYEKRMVHMWFDRNFVAPH